jgi:hypothetical protein
VNDLSLFLQEMQKQKIINRKEIKYYINYIDYLSLSNRISNIFYSDKNSNKDGCYHIRSLYFDNKSNDNYHDKINGIEKRRKYRIRIYNLKLDPVKLEIKNKINNVVSKEIILIKKSDIKMISSGKFDFLLSYNNIAANKIYSDFSKDHFSPVILIDYLREAYNYDINNIRINFDREIKKSELEFEDIASKNIDMGRVFKNKKIILEIKYNDNLPGLIKNLLQLPRFERCAISKYTLSRYMAG